MSDPREPLMPWYGYVAINGVVWLVIGAVFAGVRMGLLSSPPWIDRPGVLPFLLLIPICFLIASVYDAFFDRWAYRPRDRAAVRPRSEE